MVSVDLDAVHALALQLGKDAGKMLDDGWRLRVSGGAQAQQVEKDSAVDIVTQTDLDSSTQQLVTSLMTWARLAHIVAPGLCEVIEVVVEADLVVPRHRSSEHTTARK
ncbi:hypothetical protein LTR56_019850 [Elasticomyces elasticus]|nr:hypothetical protein LTR56_019850 [Elasticomyces elasticus]KAK3666206.1 hypothetical protein LTR22_002870 [Elasticomyces elasticus]KAK4926803.1 hypothetical protein LTR49_006219 [Elasticomyces elasticus]KAK5763638.1 hypothetical protein LTS12_006195 [Elasticomyces elasticus]